MPTTTPVGPTAAGLFGASPATAATTSADFARILKTRAPAFQSPLSGLAALASGGPAGLGTMPGLMGGSGSIEALIALSVATVIERLLAEPAPSLPASGLPVDGRITQEFHPGHGGTDIAVPVGTPIPTTLAGEVVHAGWNNEGYGNLVIVQNGRYRTYYAHLSEIDVHVGDQVAAGSIVGQSGSTGNSTGPHLHYEVRLDGTPVPAGQLNP